MVKKSTVLIGKGVRVASRLRGGGSALPGLAVEKIDKTFLKKALATLPHGVIVISGTNGKTTTSKIVTELLESQGFKVFSNSTGSNFKRGVISALISEMDLNGNLDADIAVLELDEAHAVHFVSEIKPRYSLLLNVMRDQLDRFGEIDVTAGMLQKIALATKDIVVINREDARLRKIADNLGEKKIKFFGIDPKLQENFPNDDEMYGVKKSDQPLVEAEVILSDFKDSQAEIYIDNKPLAVNLKITGIYNIFNIAAALCLVKAVCENDINLDALAKRLEDITPAFGRGEVVHVNGQPLELVLVKNPAGFRLGLKSFNSSNVETMIAINDNYADGRDMSWLWDVDFTSLGHSVNTVSGIRAYDMALRLQYDDIHVDLVEPKLSKALDQFIESKPTKPKRIFCTYTAMLEFRQLLRKKTDIERVL